MSKSYEQYAADLKGAPRRLTRILREEVATKAAKDAQKRAKLRVARRFINRTGNLRRSVTGRVQVLNRGFGIALSAGGPGIPYARIQELGGIVRARRAPFLIFQTDDGKWHSKKSVTLKGRFYLRDSIAATREAMRPDFTRAIAASIVFEGAPSG